MSFPEADDLELQREVATLEEQIQQFDQWVVHHAAAREQTQYALPKGLAAQILKRRRQARNLAVAADVPVALAIYGASQCGKSLLVGRLTQSRDGATTTLGLGGEADPTPPNLSFIDDLNPALGFEATAVVTRFTVSDRAGIAEAFRQFPVRARLFSTADILKALGRGFLTECTGEKEWTEDSVRELLDKVLVPQYRGTAVHPEWRADIDEATSYLKEAMRHHLLKIDPVALGQLIIRAPLTSEGYLKLACHLFWEDWAPISLLFEKLWRLRTETFGQTSSILMAWHAVHFILDSSRAPSYESAALGGRIEWARVRLCDVGGQRILRYGTTEGLRVPLDLLQGIVSELQIPLAEDRLDDLGVALFRKADVLDIPGARATAGTGGADAEAVAKEEEAKPLHVLKRGKVGLMFDKYGEELQANVVLYLQAMEQLESRGELAPQIQRWGRSRFHPQWPDELPEDERDSPSLFIGLTKVDFKLALKPSVDTFETSINQELAQHFTGWINDYGQEDHTFRNIHLVRYPGIIDKEEPHKHLDLEGWREAFLASPAVRRYIENPQEKWRAAFEPGNTGVKLLIDAVLRKLDNTERRDNLRRRVASYSGGLEAIMRGLYVDPSAQAQVEARSQVAVAVVEWLRGDRNGVRTRALIDQLHCDGNIAEAAVRAAIEANDTPVTRLDYREIARQILNHWQTSREWQGVSLAGHTMSGATIEENTLSRLGSYLVDYLVAKCLDDLSARLAMARQVTKADVRDIVFRRYAEIVFDDYLLTPGPRPPLPDDGPTDTGAFCHEKLRERWESMLAARLAEAVEGGETILPAGNAELGSLLGVAEA